MMQYGRSVQMFCQNMLQGGSGSLFKIQVFWTVSHYTFSSTSVRTSQLSDSITLTEIQTLIPPATLSPTTTLHSVTIYLLSMSHMSGQLQKCSNMYGHLHLH